MDQSTTFRAGDSAAWTLSLPDHPASAGWVLKYRLLGQSGTATDITATANGDDFDVALTSDDTKEWVAGTATLVCIVEKDDQKITLGASLVTILPDLSVATNHDGRTKNEKGLADAEAALEAYLAAGQAVVQEYDVAGRKMIFRSVAEIEALINLYRRRVSADRTAQALLAGGSVSGRVYYRG